MIRYRQHIPGFVTGFEPAQGVSPGLDSLLALDFLRSRQYAGFKRWSLADGRSLMAEYDDGKFWVAAHLEPDSLDELSSLPKWEIPARAVPLSKRL